MIKLTEKYIKIDTTKNTLLLEKYGDRVLQLYYGKKLHDSDNYGFFAVEERDKWFGSNDDHTNIPTVFSCNGECANKEAYVILSKEDGTFTSRFEFKGAEMAEGFSSPLPTARNKGETVRLCFTDLVTGATVYQYYTVFEDCACITVHSEVVNNSGEQLFVKRLMSCQLDFAAEKASVTTYDGTWDLERLRHDTELTAGRFEIDSKLGISSANHNPFFMVKTDNTVMGFNLVWSGNHKETVEISPYERMRILTGLNDYGFNYKLNAGETFVSPEAVFVAADTEGEVSREMHKFSLKHVVNPNFAYKPRPVLINNWEATYFDFTGDKIYEIAKKAKECGIEMMVLDDGWFGARNNDRAGLGDWYDNVEKTGGLKSLSDKIHELGLKFGLWVEPEMIQVDSDLYRAHPEYAMQIPGLTPIERRHQLCVDMCNPELRQYLTDTLIKLFKDLGVDYVKWDHNRAMSDVYSSCEAYQGNYFYDYYVNQYKMLKDITEAVPDVLFESCASGGSRYDLGMQYFMPQNWCSDNTNAFARLFIQEGTLAGYPVSSLGAHVPNHWERPGVSWESRFNVSAMGAFGYECDITSVDRKTISVIKKQVAYFKKHRNVFQYVEYYRLGESLCKSDLGGWSFVSEDKKEAIAVIIDKKVNNFWFKRPRFTFAGLNPDYLYKVEMRPQSNLPESKVFSFTAYGDALMNGKLDFDNLYWHETDGHDMGSVFASRMFYIKKIGR
ncbi:MAG: alpha-galactosidase [Clostridia bacterium]|nr:alpha-galactosidase [Clostridia bacterium]